RNVVRGRAHLGQHRADVRGVVRRHRLPAQAVVHGVEVVADVADVPHRVDDGNVLRQRGQLLVQLAQAQTWDGRGDRTVRPADLVGGIWLKVPGVEVTRPAAQPDEDARLRGRPLTQRSIRVYTGRHQARPGQIRRTDRAGLE